MATLREPTAAQLVEARAILRTLVLPYQFDGEAPGLWRACHAALCEIERSLGLDYTLPPRDERRKRTATE